MPFDATQNPKQLAADCLRNTKKTQGHSVGFCEGRYCALGVIASEIMGMSDEQIGTGHYWKVEDFLDLALDPIWRMNDFGKSFTEIADWLETQ